ncbi:MAG: formylglycine-generating enzyme family protein, partial [Planctomycetes bacterium]|nr:formylglycine-generating enzyme family protein [Planctomycetota bacterium]
ALRQRPVDIKPWHGPTRGFSYPREVQVPVIDKYCVGCHNGQPQADGTTIADLRGTERIKDWKLITAGNGGNRGGKFSVGYAELHRFVRRPGIESDYHMLNPMEYHADTTQLIQMLKKGHHNVKLDAEAWDRLITWIDLNCPYHGTWGEELANPGVQRQRRRELLQLYGGIDDDPEAVPEMSDEPVEFVAPQPLPTVQAEKIACPDWPLTAEQAKALQAAAGTEIRRTIQLAEGMTIEMVLIPAGEFVMGSTDGAVDERPRARVRIEKPFWMSVGEVSNAQFAVFDPTHNSRVETKNAYQFGIHGYPMNQPEQPAVRVTNKAATAFCRWLSKEVGHTFSLPTEAQWEYAARAGTETPFFYGDLDTDFSKFANLGDAKMVEFVTNPYTVFSAYKNPPKYDDWIPKETRFNDGSLLTVAPCTYEPNAWGLHDRHGNAAEWTRTTYREYPYEAEDGRDAADLGGRKVVRGGSWRDRPMRCTSSFRLGYQPHQGVYNVGFRLVCPAGPEIVAVK